MGFKCAAYIRVSTDEQSVENQLPALKLLAERLGGEIVEVYQEEASAWKDGHQVELARLREDGRKGKFRVLLVWSLDRLSREGVLAILKLVEAFKQAGIKIVSYQESWTEAPGELAELLYAITGWVARMESERRSQRTKAGMERARKTGAPIGKRGPDQRKRNRRWRVKPAV